MQLKEKEVMQAAIELAADVPCTGEIPFIVVPVPEEVYMIGHPARTHFVLFNAKIGRYGYEWVFDRIDD